MKKTVLYLLLFFSIYTLTAQNNILIIDYNNAFSSDQSTTWNKSEVYNRLVATNTSVTRIAAIPATISTAYDACWIFGNMGTTTAANLNPVVTYINAGGSVYVQSEVGCCPNQAAFVDNLINSVTIAGGSITHSLIKSYKFEAVIHPDLTCGPFPLRYGASARLFVGTPSNNVLFEANTTCGTPLTTGDIVGVRFGACDMISGKGALISNGDFNIFPQGTCTSTGILGTPNNPNIIDMIDNLLDSLKYCKTTGCPVLPVELISFDGINKGSENELSWSAASEINNNYYSVERSTDGMDFIEIGRIQGAGNSNYQTDYQFTDEHPEEGVNYYRLRQTDFNQAYTFSQMISLNVEASTLFVYPNPAHDKIHVNLNKLPINDGIVQVFDAQGKLVWNEQLNESQTNFQLSTESFPQGLYFMQLNAQGAVYKATFIKQ